MCPKACLSTTVCIDLVETRDDRKRFTITQNCSPGSYAIAKRNTAVGCIAMKVGFGKGGLISKSFSFWLKSPKKRVPNHAPEHYPPKGIVT